MSARGLLRSRKLDEIGVEHGFGTLHSVPITPTDVVFVKQVHGATLVRAEPGAARVEADALWTDRPGSAVMRLSMPAARHASMTTRPHWARLGASSPST